MNLELAIDDPDAFYAALIARNEGLTEEQSHAVMLRLVFLLANQVRDTRLIETCIDEAAKPFVKELSA